MALDLVQRIGEVLVKRIGVVVVRGLELFCRERLVVWIGRHGIGHCVTKGKVIDDFAVFL